MMATMSALPDPRITRVAGISAQLIALQRADRGLRAERAKVVASLLRDNYTIARIAREAGEPEIRLRKSYDSEMARQKRGKRST